MIILVSEEQEDYTIDMTRRRENIQLTRDVICLKKESGDKGGWEDNDFKHI